MLASPELIGQAVEFRDRVAELLNATVTDNVHLGVLFDERSGECRIAPGISTSQMKGTAVPLAFSNQPPKAFLDLSHRLILDAEGIWLTDARSRYAVYRDEALARPLFSYDYERGNTPHPEVHLHVRGDFIHGSPDGVRPLRKLHFPMSGRRFRLTLEDIIEFVINEGFCAGKAGWQRAVDDHRAGWVEIQVKAAVRRFPEAARAALQDLQ